MNPSTRRIGLLICIILLLCPVPALALPITGYVNQTAESIILIPESDATPYAPVETGTYRTVYGWQPAIDLVNNTAVPDRIQYYTVYVLKSGLTLDDIPGYMGYNATIVEYSGVLRYERGSAKVHIMPQQVYSGAKGGSYHQEKTWVVTYVMVEFDWTFPTTGTRYLERTGSYYGNSDPSSYFLIGTKGNNTHWVDNGGHAVPCIQGTATYGADDKRATAVYIGGDDSLEIYTLGDFTNHYEIDIVNNNIEVSLSRYGHSSKLVAYIDGVLVNETPYSADDGVYTFSRGCTIELVPENPAFDAELIYQDPVVANFAASPTSGKEPLTVQFTDTSTGTPTSWFWDFGDGYTSTAQNPSHIYLYPGQYSVSLYVVNNYSSDQVAKASYITVSPSKVPPIADFFAVPTSGTSPLTVSFVDTSANNPTSWSWEFGDGWGSSARNPTHTYVAPGTYTVTLTAYNNAGSDVETKTACITIGGTPQPSDAILNGYAYDNTNNVLLDGVTITIENETYSTTNTTHGGGFYQFTGLTSGTYTVKGEKAGYLPSPGYAVQLYSGAVVQRDISLGVSGVAIVGTVYDAVTGETKNGANVTATQGTASYTSTGAGQYALNGLSKGVETTISATLAGYTHTPVTLTPTSSTPYTVDLYLIPDTITHNGTALAGLVTDAATHKAIQNAQVVLPGHANATTSPTGFYLFDDLAAGSYYVSASATGYKPSPDYATTLTEGNITWQDITLDPSTETATHMDYPPHLVRFLCVDEYNRPLQNVTIQAVYQESSSPIDWLAEWLGIAPNVQITTETLEGTTGLDGSVVFLMVESVQYRITVAAPAPINMTKTFDIYPKEDQVTIRFQTRTHTPSAMPTYGLTATETDPSTVRLALTYNDTTNATTHLAFQVYDHATGDLIHTQTFDASKFPGTVSPSYDVSNTNGAMYRFGFTAQNSAHGEISQYKGITLKGDNLLVDLGFEDRTLYQWLAVLLLFLFAGAFSGTNVKQGAILVPLFGGGLFWFIGWLPISLGAAISAIGFLGVLVYMRKSEWKVRA